MQVSGMRQAPLVRTFAHSNHTMCAHWLASGFVCVQGSMKSSYLSPSPPISGRDISALAVIRRPSWSGAARTGSYDGSTAAAGAQVSKAPLTQLLLLMKERQVLAIRACSSK